MGRKSTRQDKSVYQLAREEVGLTREAAAERMPGMSAERLEKLESGRTVLQPEDVLAMASCYKAPVLCNRFCTGECAIGREKMPETSEKPIAQIAVETINALNALNRERDRLLEIVEDGRIRTDEEEDFRKILASLRKMTGCIDSLSLWIEEQIAEGNLAGNYSPKKEE